VRDPLQAADPVLGGVSLGFIWPEGRWSWRDHSESVASLTGISHRISASAARHGRGLQPVNRGTNVVHMFTFLFSRLSVSESEFG
jgi:hypothetical protein